MTTFSEIVDAADQLSVDEQQTLVEILDHRLADRNRKQIIRDVAEARAEFASGTAQTATAKQIMDEVGGGAGELIRTSAFVRAAKRY